MQNADASGLEAGDVVTIVGNSAAVIGDIPVVTVKKASTAYDTGVVGIVDQAVYVPDAANPGDLRSRAAGAKSCVRTAPASPWHRQKPQAPSLIRAPCPCLPQPSLTHEGTVHAVSNATTIATSGYANVVTLGSYKAVKVDASFGAIHPGDLLVASTHAGYAMKATDKTQTSGAVIGKALGGLETGTGVVPVMVTLK